MDRGQLDRAFTLHQCFKYVRDDDVIRTVFAEVQQFKGMKNYFTDSLLYQEDIESLKQSLPDDIDSGNEADSKSEEDAPTTISIESIVTYLNDYDCNSQAENEGEWSLMRILFLITLCALRMCLSRLAPYICLYQSRKWHACIYKTMKGLSSLPSF